MNKQIHTCSLKIFIKMLCLDFKYAECITAAQQGCPISKAAQMGPRIAHFISCAVKDRPLHHSQPIISQDSLCVCDG